MTSARRLIDIGRLWVDESASGSLGGFGLTATGLVGILVAGFLIANMLGQAGAALLLGLLLVVAVIGVVAARYW